MDKTALVNEVAQLLLIADCDVQTSVIVGNREIDVVAKERSGVSRKTILIECADYSTPVGVDKIQGDHRKLDAARDVLKENCTLLHVSRLGYSPNASGWALSIGFDAITIATLTSRLMNFDSYVASIFADRLRPVILNEYQPTKIHPEGQPKKSMPALVYLKEWLSGDSPWMTVLGDYGVGKSWTLRRLLYDLTDEYVTNPQSSPLPLYVPLQLFTKAFDFQTLITTTLQNAGVSTINYGAFEYLASRGRIIFLLDAFDEMAQTIRGEILRENLSALLVGVSKGSKAILTSRPTYFESRAERLLLVEKGDRLIWEPGDRQTDNRRTRVAEVIESKLTASSYSRLRDLTPAQRKSLFEKVLEDKPRALKQLNDLFARFHHSLDAVSQRAVIARLLTSVAETLADSEQAVTPDGYPLLPQDVVDINEAKIFQLVVNNLLFRDLNSGGISAGSRQLFLRALACFLQQPGRSPFATPAEVRSLIETLFAPEIQASDSPNTVMENYYRTCRRHSGLTTQGQFLDTTGSIDVPVDEDDVDSPIGFSHNALREFLVADTAADYLVHERGHAPVISTFVSEAVANFLTGISVYDKDLKSSLQSAYAESSEGRERQWLFQLILGFVRQDPRDINLVGKPISLDSLDLGSIDLSGLNLSRGTFEGSLLMETDLRDSNLKGAHFGDAVLERTQFDGAELKDCDLRSAEILSVYVYDPYVRRTSAVLEGLEAEQWLFASGARVANEATLNPHLGRPWYEAAREVARSLSLRMAGTHQLVGLSKGTRLEHRDLARDFCEYLIKRKILRIVTRNPGSGDKVVQVTPQGRSVISSLAVEDRISAELVPFFDEFVDRRD